MPQSLVLYSTVTWIAHVIAEQYYGNVHYAWCTPCFSPDSDGCQGGRIVPTSCPSIIYHSLWEEVQAGDLHSSKINENRVGIAKGASFKRKQGVITAKQEKDILKIIDKAQTRDFRPLVYVIPFDPVSNLVKAVPPTAKAHPLSIEFIIETLPRDRFDIINLRRS